MEAVHGRVAAIVNASTHPSRVGSGSQRVAGEDEAGTVWFCVRGRDYRGSDPNVGRPVVACASLEHKQDPSRQQTGHSLKFTTATWARSETWAAHGIDISSLLYGLHFVAAWAR